MTTKTASKRTSIQSEGLFDQAASETRTGGESTFGGNMTMAVHRWFRYSAGFSAPWAQSEISRQRSLGRTKVLDPFAGSGTSLIAAQNAHVNSIGYESHPFVARIAKAKLLWSSDITDFAELGKDVLNRAKAISIQRFT
ncbi:MAG TPA: DNA methyltransferase, partial [Candidatus Kapabacteria bacterium]|nr:DNA methyltransferase [Candidatus Kapabacteria bacterium]